MARKTYPEYHKTLMDQGFYPTSKRRIKFEETPHALIYRAGDFIYKIRKHRHGSDNPALKEKIAREALARGRQWAPEVYQDLLPLYRTAEGYSLQGSGEVLEFLLKLTQYSEHYFLKRVLSAGKLTPTGTGRLARYLAEHHANLVAGEKGIESGKPEFIRDLMEEVLYQSKKYINQTLPAPLLDMVSRPVHRFIEDNRKLFVRRVKKNRIVECHGAFLPEHIYLKSKEIFAISPQADMGRYRLMDAAYDVAMFLNELELAGAAELIELFQKRYITASKDRDLPKVITLYQTLSAMRTGLIYSERLIGETTPEDEKPGLIEAAHRYYNLGLKIAREIPQQG